jgi:NhaP-type Na+/H+ or K+/H+ antiporter
LSVWWLGLPLWSALLVSAILTPTDPIVSTPIVSGEIADKELPPWVQQGISAESGANDGLGFIFVALPVYILTMGGHDAWTHWLVHGWLWELGVAAIVGIASGWLAGKLLNWDVQHNEIERTGYLGFTLALPIVVMTLTRLLEADGILAAFLAGVVLDQLISDDHQEHQEEIQEAINKFLTVTIFMLLGAFLPWKEWAELGWDTAAALAGILILRRAITIVLIRRILRPSMRRDETLFLSWFAPIGIAALYYVVWAEDQTGDRSLWPIISLAITLSVVLHGITATPFSRWLGREEHAR